MGPRKVLQSKKLNCYKIAFLQPSLIFFKGHLYQSKFPFPISGTIDAQENQEQTMLLTSQI